MREITPPPWTEHYAKAVPYFIPEDSRPLHHFFEQSVLDYADRPCLDFLSKTYTYAEVGDLVDRAARGFQLLGVRKGTKVGLFLPNTPYYLICYYAILSIGGTVVNYNPLYAPKELEFQAKDSQTEIMVTLDLQQLFPKVQNLLDHNLIQKIVICSMSDILPPVKSILFQIFKRSQIVPVKNDLQHLSFEDLVNTDGLPSPVEIDVKRDVAVLQYTGGTTGVPKGAVLTHANLVANLNQVRAWFPEVKKGNERILCVLPYFHVFAMTVELNLGIASGMELIMVPRFEIKDTLKIIQERRPTLFPGVPTLYNAIASDPAIKDYDLSSIQYCISGGAPLPLEVKERFEAVTGCYLVEGYGLTESSPVATCNPIGGKSKEGSIGLPLPSMQIIVCDPDNPKNILGPFEKGEICIKGPQIMKGYWQHPNATKDVLEEGLLRTGDLGYLDEEGYVFLIDRAKDLIICNGYNVYPRHVEDAIYKHPAVDEVIVIGINDEFRGQTPKAFIKLKDEHSLDRQELNSFLKDHLSPIERPSQIEFRNELPKTMIGKLSKKELVEEEREK